MNIQGIERKVVGLEYKLREKRRKEGWDQITEG